MMRTGLGVAILILAAAPAWAELKFENIQACYGPLGPERKSLECYPFDEVEFRYIVRGVRIDDDGQVDGELTFRVLDPSGKEQLKRTSELVGLLALGGDYLPGRANVILPGGLPEGPYTITVTYRDNLSGETAQFERKIDLKAETFALVSPRFYYDADGKVPAPVGGRLSQTLHFKVRAIGFDRTQGMIDAEMEFQVLDGAGKPVAPMPTRARLQNNDPQVVRKAPFLSFTGQLALNRIGDFTLRLTVTDRVGKKSATFETPLKVTAP